jgi:two-component system OmpR family response regulator/two-component system response regulator QseB
MRLLLVEDDRMIAENIFDGLTKANYAVDWASTGSDAELAMATNEYDLVLLDLGLPGKQGMDVLRTLRHKGENVPVLILTAQGGLTSRVEGLDAGADDYLVKPFDLDELFARVRALLRRRVSRSSSVVEFGDIRVNLASHEVTLRNQPLHLSAMEFSVLRALLDDPGKVVTKRQLEQRLYGWTEEVESNAVDVFVHRLRKKIGADSIRTVRGVGFRMADAP